MNIKISLKQLFLLLIIQSSFLKAKSKKNKKEKPEITKEETNKESPSEGTNKESPSTFDKNSKSKSKKEDTPSKKKNNNKKTKNEQSIDENPFANLDTNLFETKSKSKSKKEDTSSKKKNNNKKTKNEQSIDENPFANLDTNLFETKSKSKSKEKQAHTDASKENKKKGEEKKNKENKKKEPSWLDKALDSGKKLGSKFLNSDIGRTITNKASESLLAKITGQKPENTQPTIETQQEQTHKENDKFSEAQKIIDIPIDNSIIIENPSKQSNNDNSDYENLQEDPIFEELATEEPNIEKPHSAEEIFQHQETTSNLSTNNISDDTKITPSYNAPITITHSGGNNIKNKKGSRKGGGALRMLCTSAS